MESHMGGIFHASDYRLAKIDHEQNRFLRELGISAADAFMEFNFAPPQFRRNIGVLGLVRGRQPVRDTLSIVKGWTA